ncbi:MAG: MATE family efflux transporter [Muribaculaceae bacterium]|nr:MATE family efflux transporter [Muribaculaceae bacterium]
MEIEISKEEGGISVKRMTWMLLSLAFPAIVSNITVPLLGLSDTYITGHLGAEVYVAAIAVGTMLVNALYWLCGFLRMGTTGLTAEAYGREDQELRADILYMSLLIAFAIGLGLILLSPLLKGMLLGIMAPPDEVGMLGGSYFEISVWGAPAILGTMSLVGWMVGSQNTLYPMIVSIGVNVVNIIVSFTLVFGMETGFIGVAYGTLIANWLGLLAALWFASRILPGGRFSVRLRGLGQRVDARRFFRVNGNLFVRSACLMSVSFALTSYAGKIGENALAVNAVLMQFFLFFSYFMDGFAFGGEALCGRFAGSRQRGNLKMSIKVLGMVSAVVAAVFTAVYCLYTPAIAGMITDVDAVVAGIRKIEWVAWVLPAVSVCAFMFDGVYVGLTATGKMMIATMISAALFFGVHLMPYVCGGEMQADISPEGWLWVAYLTFLGGRGVVLGMLLPSEIERSGMKSKAPISS